MHLSERTNICPGQFHLLLSGSLETSKSEGDKNMTDETQGGGFGWFLLGLGVGAAIGVLYAPKSGNETREDILQGAREGSEYLKNKSRVAADQVGNLIEV